MISEKDNSYWDNFYSKKNLLVKPSSFALDVVKHLEKGKTLLELGCGNGRDSFFFSEYGLNVIALDLSSEAIDLDRNSEKGNDIQFMVKDFTNLNQNEFQNLDYIYSRFTLHSIEKNDYLRTINWVSKNINKGAKFFIEARTINDPLFGDGNEMPDDGFINTHYRRFFRIKEVMKELTDVGLHLLHVSENHTDSWYKDDHAVVLRIVCEKR